VTERTDSERLDFFERHRHPDPREHWLVYVHKGIIGFFFTIIEKNGHDTFRGAIDAAMDAESEDGPRMGRDAERDSQDHSTAIWGYGLLSGANAQDRR
jgi:hypothetical protein